MCVFLRAGGARHRTIVLLLSELYREVGHVHVDGVRGVTGTIAEVTSIQRELLVVGSRRLHVSRVSRERLATNTETQHERTVVKAESFPSKGKEAN